MKPITNMAFYCCGVRREDAAQVTPVCGDDYAKLFMDAQGESVYALFRDEANCNSCMLVRHRIIDDLLRQMLIAHPDLCVISIGAGFDSRPYRLTGGSWIELDEAPVIAYKEQQLPAAACPNPLQRIAIDFCRDALADKLSFITHDGPIVVVMEGVFIYLDEAETRQVLTSLHQLFPAHWLICDLVNREMVNTYGQSLHRKVEQIGTAFKARPQPAAAFTGHDYRIKNRISVAECAADLGVINMPKFFLRFFYSSNVYGNSVYVFDAYELYRDLVI